MNNKMNSNDGTLWVAEGEKSGAPAVDESSLQIFMHYAGGENV